MNAKPTIQMNIIETKAMGRTRLIAALAAIRKWNYLIAGIVVSAFIVCGPALLAADAAAIGAPNDSVSASKAIGLSLAATLCVGMSILGAGYAVGRIGSAAIGAISEKPELLPRAMLFVALGEGLAVLGFAFAIWLLLRM